MEKEIVKKKKSSQSTRLKNQIKKIEETKVDTINFDDLQLLDENFDIDTVVANGRVMIENKEILVYGSYEQI